MPCLAGCAATAFFKKRGFLMPGGKIDRLGAKKSAFIEFFFKPTIVSAALFARCWLSWASPPHSFRYSAIITASNKACKKIWGCPVLEWKMFNFAYTAAALCEADNAYATWFDAWVREYVNEMGLELAPKGTLARLEKKGGIL